MGDVGDSVYAPNTTLARIPKRRFCPDTEEVTGSNPVSPTSKTPDQGHLAVLTPPPPSRVLVNLLVYGLAVNSRSMTVAPVCSTGRSWCR